MHILFICLLDKLEVNLFPEIKTRRRGEWGLCEGMLYLPSRDLIVQNVFLCGQKGEEQILVNLGFDNGCSKF